MFGAFREKLLSWSTKVLFGLLIISFGLWGIGDYNFSGSSGNDAVAEVGDRKITGRALDNEVQNTISRMRGLFGPEFSDEQARAMGIVDQTLNTLVRQNIFAVGAEEAGLIVDDNMLGKVIRDDKQFQYAGQFSRDAFFQALNRAGLSEAAYASFYRSQLLQNQLLSPIKLGLATPVSLIDKIYRYRNEKRVAELFRLDHEKFSKIPEPDANQLIEFHKDNAQLFTAPEYRKLTAVLLQPEVLADGLHVPEDRIREEYESRINDFTEFERRDIQQILVSDEATIRKIKKRLSRGEEFSKVAKQLANIDESSLRLGNLAKKDIPIVELAEVAFKLSPNSSSLPIKTALGWHILKVGDITEGRQKTLDQVRPQLKRAVQLDLAADALVSLANKFEDDLGSGSTLEEAARRLDLKVIKVSAIDERGLNDKAKIVPNIGSNQKIVRVAFQTEEGQDSMLTDFGRASFFILRVDKVIPPSLRPLDKIREGVAAAWKRNLQAGLSEKKTAEILAQLNSGKSLEKVAKDLAGTLIETKPFNRSGQGLEIEIPRELVQKLFSVNEQIAVSASGNGAHFIARVKDIKAAKPGKDEPRFVAIREQIGLDIGNDLAEGFATALRSRLGVVIHRDVINAYFKIGGAPPSGTSG